MDDHLSHQNGLDAGVYLPRVDRRLSAPTASGKIDHRLESTGQSINDGASVSTKLIARRATRPRGASCRCPRSASRDGRVRIGRLRPRRAPTGAPTSTGKAPLAGLYESRRALFNTASRNGNRMVERATSTRTRSRSRTSDQRAFEGVAVAGSENTRTRFAVLWS